MDRSESHPDLYRNELIRLKYGNPIWEPNPGTLYDCVRIGDVGYFQNDQFMPLFNILAPSDDSNQNRRLPFPQPTNFPALYLPETHPTTQIRHPLQAGVYALESSLTFSASMGLDSGGSVLNGESSLSFTNEKGAALILPYEACREDTLYDELFKKHMLRCYRRWYTFALTKCHRNIKLCDLILVTGCDMSRQWATATYFRHIREMSAALGAQVAPVIDAKFSLSAGWTTTQPVITRWGPPQALHQQTRLDYEGTQNDGETLVNDQCIFLRGLYIKDRFLGLGPQVMKAGAGYHDPGKHGPEEEGVEGVLSDDGVTVEALLPSTQGQRFMTVLLNYMLEECDADVVIASDSDLWPYLGEVENLENFRDTLKGISPPIKVEDGVGSLMQMTSESESVKKKKRAKFLIGIENQYHMAKTQARKDLEDHEYASDTLDVFMTQLKEIGSDEIPGYFSENNGRLFPSARLTSYPFPVDTPEQERVNLLHQILNRFNGAHYVGPVSDVLSPESERQKMVLDLCTGNGKWVLDMAREFSHVHFIGIDIVPIATQHPPPRVLFEVHDVNNTYRWKDGTFDLVHARSVSMAVRDYPSILQEVARVLRPSGLFVSCELGSYVTFDPSFQQVPSIDAPATFRFFNAIDNALAAHGIQPIAHQIPTFIANSGLFVDITVEQKPIPIGVWPSDVESQNIGADYLTVCRRYADSSESLLLAAGWSEATLERMITDYIQEIHTVRGLVEVLHTVHARRV